MDEDTTNGSRILALKLAFKGLVRKVNNARKVNNEDADPLEYLLLVCTARAPDTKQYSPVAVSTNMSQVDAINSLISVLVNIAKKNGIDVDELAQRMWEDTSDE